MAVTAAQVAAILGRGDDSETVALAGAHLPLVTVFVKAYVRGNGFTADEPNADLSAVITTATARLVVNPEQVKRYQTADYAETPAVLDGFTLPELAVLHLYRRRTA
ncbi:MULTISPECIES: hypothetical protein [Oerskovia]|uniref:Phage gp6-like head-tail connector protein n=1 Tax=Oerskovia merdavium TaxID=2762227 RepID=A0ABR8TW66_9CELL|nr:hypothetical protein [Oerskovia merdavium]MBD7980034.1 hypothetical protein [Oerskovia merdavium]